VASIQSLQEFQNLTASAFPENNPVGAHPERLTQQRSQCDFSEAVGIRGTRLQGDEVRVAGGKLRRIFQSQDAIGCWNFLE
jgi:hypothetical protein